MRAGVGFTASLVLVASLVAATVTVETVNAQADPVATTSVSLQGTAFVPPDIIVLKGSKVTWTNKDSTVHTVTNDGGSETIREPFAPAAASPLAVQDYTFNNLGFFKYFCEVHPSMRGTVEVVEAFDPAEVPIVFVNADDTNVFSPKLLAINVTQGITWNNAGQNLHDVTFQDESIGGLGDLAAGATITHNFTKEGTYAYRCKYHSTDFSRGMVGHVAVGQSAILPILITILFPGAGSNVTGNVTIAGSLESGPGSPTVDVVELAFDGGTNWSTATGTGSWSYTWDSTTVSDGNATIMVRAVGGNETLATANQSVVVVNGAQVAGPTSDSSSNGTPGVGLPLAALAVGWAARRRRR